LHRAHSLRMTRGQSVKIKAKARSSRGRSQATIFLSWSCPWSRGQSSKTASLWNCDDDGDSVQLTVRCSRRGTLTRCKRTLAWRLPQSDAWLQWWCQSHATSPWTARRPCDPTVARTASDRSQHAASATTAHSTSSGLRSSSSFHSPKQAVPLWLGEAWPHKKS